MRKIIALLSFVILFALLSLRLAQAQSEEAQGQAAEQVGRYREAVNYYVAALQSTSDGSAKDQQLREKIIGLVQRLQPPPAVTEEAERYLARGRAAFKAAKNPKDYEEAVAEFKKAARIAPWLGEAYYNLGVVQDKAGQYAEAIRNLKLYLLAAPNAPDAKEVKSLIFEVEYRQEKAGKDATVKREAEEQERRRQEQAKREAEDEKQRQLAGIWRSSFGSKNPQVQISVQGAAVEVNFSFYDALAEGRYLYTFSGTRVGDRLSGFIKYTIRADWLRDCGGKIGFTSPATGNILPDGNHISMEWESPERLPGERVGLCQWGSGRQTKKLEVFR